MSQRLGDEWTVALALLSLATVSFEAGEVERAAELGEIALVLFRGQGHLWGIGRALHVLGRAAQSHGDHQAARRFLTESLWLQRQQSDRQGMTRSLINLSRTALNQRDYTEARQLLEEGLGLAQESGDRLSVVRGLEQVALAAASRYPYPAVVLLEAAHVLRTALQSARSPQEREPLDTCLETARAALGEDAFNAAHLTGERIGIEDAIAEAVRVVSCLTVPSS